jgi:hypothetical protein
VRSRFIAVRAVSPSRGPQGLDLSNSITYETVSGFQIGIAFAAFQSAGHAIDVTDRQVASKRGAHWL